MQMIPYQPPAQVVRSGQRRRVNNHPVSYGTVDALATALKGTGVAPTIKVLKAIAKQATAQYSLGEGLLTRKQRKVVLQQERANGRVAKQHIPRQVVNNAKQIKAVKAVVASNMKSVMGARPVIHSSGARYWHGESPGSIRIKHSTEFMPVIASTDGFNLGSAQLINPLNTTLFPHLSRIAKSFQHYRFHSITFSFKSMSSSFTPGIVRMTCDSDPDGADPPRNGQEFSEFTNAVRGQFNSTQQINCHASQGMLKALPVFKIRQADVDPGQDSSSVGRFYYATEGAPVSTAVLGTLCVSYDCELELPSPDHNSQDDYYRGHATADPTTPLGSGWGKALVTNSFGTGIYVVGWSNAVHVHAPSADSFYEFKMIISGSGAHAAVLANYAFAGFVSASSNEQHQFGVYDVTTASTSGGIQFQIFTRLVKTTDAGSENHYIDMPYDAAAVGGSISFINMSMTKLLPLTSPTGPTYLSLKYDQKQPVVVDEWNVLE